MWHAMSMKEAVKQWEAMNKQKISTATEIKLNGICPSLDKIDTIALSFINCEKLSLSSNAIERISNLGSMKHLKILSLGRNQIKSVAGIEAVADTLEELWISYNQIDKLKGIGVLKKLRVLLMSNNNVRDWCEFMRLSELTTLKELVFVGNPLEERCSSEGIWRSEVVRRLPHLAKLDGHQCMETEVNLTDTQTELQNTEADEDENQTSKFDVLENGELVDKEEQPNEDEGASQNNDENVDQNGENEGAHEGVAEGTESDTATKAQINEREQNSISSEQPAENEENSKDSSEDNNQVNHSVTEPSCENPPSSEEQSS